MLDPRTILNSIAQVVYDWRVDTDALLWGANAAEVLRFQPHTTVASGRDFAKLLDPAATASRYDAVVNSSERDAGAGVSYQLTYPLRPLGMNSAVTLWIEDTGRWFAGSDGRPQRAHGVLRVVNDRHESEQRLTFLSQFDDLTGQLNRQSLLNALEKMIEEAKRLRRSVAFLVIGMDNLGVINDAYGYSVADEVIAAVAKRLRTRMRGGDILGRFSGNKLGIAMNNCDTEEMPIAAQRYLDAVGEDSVQTSAGPVVVRVSIGGALAPRHAQTAIETTNRAQEAFTLCKATRKGGFIGFAPSQSRDDMRRENARMTDEVVSALNERRMVLAYQPIVDAKTGLPVHYECLIRLRRTDGELISAASIVPVSEKLGLVRLIDHRVMELGIAELERAPEARLAINLSATTIVDQDWLAALAVRLHRRTDLAARLTVEITESAAIADLEGMANFVRLMKEYGVKVAIDDFGAGYTSFRALRDLDIDVVKIDGVFVQNMTRSPDDRFFVRTLIDLARHLGLKTVAEWVQDAETARLLREWGCDYLQGSLYGMGHLESPFQAGDLRAAV